LASANAVDAKTIELKVISGAITTLPDQLSGRPASTKAGNK
jgi:hypothetical protein